MRTPVAFRLLGNDDIPFGMKLKRFAGWNQLPEDWERFLELEPDGCFAAVLRNGEDTPVGTATTTAYGQRFGWVGMVLVLPEYRRKGIGTALLEHAVEYLEHTGVGCVRLDATPLDKKLYDTMGFHDEYSLERVQGTGQALPFEGVELMQPGELPEVAAFDAPLFGAGREKMIELLYRASPALCFLRRDREHRVAGYLMARSGENAFQIGPWMASSAEDADALLRAGLSALDGQPIFLDVSLGQNDSTQIVSRYGFKTQREFIRMYRGQNRYPGRTASVYAICGVETG